MYNHAKINCSVGILTFNSAKTLRRALESIKNFSEILICDGGSTDGTIDIAKDYNTKIINQFDGGGPRKIENFSEARNKCLASATNDWFLYIDSDEILSEELAEEIRLVIGKNGPELIYQIPNKIIIDGKVINHSASYPGYQVRFFNRKTGAHFIKPVHERVSYDKTRFRAGKLKYPWYVCWDEEDVNGFARKAESRIPIEVERNNNWTLGQYLRWGVYKNALSVVKIFTKASKNYMLYGFEGSMPVKIEWARITYHLKLLWHVTKSRLKK